MREAREIAEHLQACAKHDLDPDDMGLAAVEIDFDGLPESEDGFTLTLVDGTEFTVLVVKTRIP